MKIKFMVIGTILITAMVVMLILGLDDQKYIKYSENTYLAVLINGVESISFPAKGYYDVRIHCANANGHWNYDTWKAEITNIVGTARCTASFTSVTPVSFTSYIKSLVVTTGEGVFLENMGGGILDYRYEGRIPNNYVFFNGELWRIIGVFSDNTHGKSGQELVKIIRALPVGGWSWQKNSVNDWEHATSSLKKLLNDYYYFGINETSITHCYQGGTFTQGICDFSYNGITSVYYRNMIENVTWKLGGRATTNATAATIYTVERGTTVYSGRPTSGTGYIGLMYPSDYGYSVTSSMCSRGTVIPDYNKGCANFSWLSGVGEEWTITPISANSYSVMSISYAGNMTLNGTGAANGIVVRPVLYLKADVKKIAGDGSITNPYIID